MRKFTQEQQQVIDFRGRRLLVSASAGTGKTTVMIQRILSLIAEGADVSQFVVVTFTNLAAAEMKARLSRELAKLGSDRRMVEQLEKLDSANISTIHSFCSELLRNYFYLVDIDPDYAILDNVTVANLQKGALEDVFKQYFVAKDEVFARVHKIFSKNRQEDNFKQVVLDLYEFARGLDDFGSWYAAKRGNFVDYADDNPVITTLLADITDTVAYCVKNFVDIAERCREEGKATVAYVEACVQNIERLQAIGGNLQQCVDVLCTTKLAKLPGKDTKKAAAVGDEIGEAINMQILSDFEAVVKTFTDLSTKYQKLFRGRSVAEMWQQTVDSVAYVDKLVEVVQRFEQAYFDEKRRVGGIDFGDLEHLALKVLRAPEAVAELAARYRYIFVDEYQDTSPIQETIVQALAASANLFMVGDVKQSIYGFRGCEPEIFLAKYNDYKDGNGGTAIKLNDNFRTNNEIFDYINALFCHVMTADFGRVDYAVDAMLRGPKTKRLPAPSVTVNLVVPQTADKPKASGMYDITVTDRTDDGLTQAKVVVDNVKKYVGTRYADEDGKEKTIDYGDIVILTRSMKDKAVDIYDALVAANIPVIANFKIDGYESKEVRDVINLLRVVDNPYDDVYMTGVCLSCFGKLTENELGAVRLDTEGRVPFYDRLRAYIRKFDGNEIAQKIHTLLDFVDKVRFFAAGATVCETVLYINKLTDYQLYVTGLPNGGLRVRKFFAFVDGLRGAAYGESVDKFLEYIDRSDDNAVEEGGGNANAVRMMTMHASKGLEFPVVIVAATESKFNLFPEAVEHNVDMGIAVNYYDFATMRVSGTLGAVACGMFNKKKQREEEMRLLYVALTRAKYVLNVVGNVTEKQLSDLPKQPAAALSHMDWILAALRTQFGDDIPAGDKLEVVVNRELPEQTQDEQTYVCPQQTDLDAVLAQMSYVYPHADQQDMPLKVVSSALDKEALALLQQDEQTDDEQAEVLVDDTLTEATNKRVTGVRRDKKPSDNIPREILAAQAERNKVGTAYHKVLQCVPLSATKGDIADILSKLVADGTVLPEHAAEVNPDVVYAILNNPEFVAIANAGKAYRELPFMLSVPYNSVVPGSRYTDNVMLQGVIDLLVVGEDKAYVLDYKYTRHSDTVAERYSAQLGSYRLAVQRICGIQSVDCYVLSIADNKLIKID